MTSATTTPTARPLTPAALRDLRGYATMELANGGPSKGGHTTLVRRGLLAPTREPTPHILGGRRAPQRYRVTREGWRMLAEEIRAGRMRPLPKSGQDDDLARYLAPAA